MAYSLYLQAMKVSLILPVWNEEKTFDAQESDLALRLSDLDSFFSRFGWDFELMVGLDKSQDRTEEIFESYPFKKLKLRMFKNRKHLGRAQTLRLLLKAAEGEVAVTLSMDLSTPLADIYALLIEGLNDKQALLTLGNTLGSKKKRSGGRFSSHFHLEQMLHEKTKLKWPLLNDPLTSLVALNSHALTQFKQDDPKISRWYFTPQLLTWAHKKNITIRQLEVQKRLKPSSRIPVIREWIKSLL